MAKKKTFRIETFDGRVYFNFLTRAYNSKGALINLQNNSTDYNNLVDKNANLKIEITTIK